MFQNSRKTKSNWGLAKLLLATIAVVLFSTQASAQEAGVSGIVSGTVVDAEFGGGVSGVRVAILGTPLTATSDKDGRFIIVNVPAGEHTVMASAMYYKASRVEELEVASGGVARVDVPLYGDNSEIVELDGFTVKAKALEGSSLALLSERQKASSISDAIGSESFSRLGVGDAADALSKTTGVSIADGKYMVVRGLSDRYNNTTLNGSTVPSADPDKRAVQLDQFPSGIIESIVTTKSFTPDKAGSFTGGSVNVVTKSIPDAGFLTFSFGVSYNEKTTFRDYLASEGGDSDWLGTDDGHRSVPQVIVDAGSVPFSPNGEDQAGLELIDAAVKSFSSELAPRLKTAPLNHSFSVSFGDRYPLNDSADGPVLGVIGSFNYKRSFSAYDDGEVGRYELVGRDFQLGVKEGFVESKGVDEAQWGSVLNAAVTFGGSHEVGVKTMYNQSGADEAIYREGEYFIGAGDGTFRVRNLHYTERALSSYQLFGEHKFDGLAGLEVNWEAATSKSVQEEPDFRLFYDSVEPGENGRAAYEGNFPGPRRYWRNLDESTDELKADFKLPFGGKSGEIKFGFLTSETTRNFKERAFIYIDNLATSYDGVAYSFLDEEKLGFNGEGQIQRYVREFAGFVPKYNGIQKTDAAYMMADFRPLEKWRLVTGARIEEANIEVQSFRANGNLIPNSGDLDNSDWLPAVQIVHELTESQNLRFAYSKTLARPNFRELSPFGSFDNVGGEVFIGNSSLTRTRIENFDLRYEWFLEGTDLLAFSVFSKDMHNPIEQNYSEGQLTYVNVDEGTVSGVEFEARRRLAFLSNENSEFSVGGNFSILESEVDRSQEELIEKRLRDPDVSLTRELQGQSSLIGNLDVFWNRIEKGESYSFVYNHTGESLYLVSRDGLPDVYQAGGDSLDFIYSRSLPRGYKMKLSIKNILDDGNQIFWDDFDEHLVYSDVSKGRTISLSFSKRFE
ncbi:TonB-dependent receptor [Pelagicoccus sp. NFK12]|uniref:TonB-dependent receptor n=1 Tax=Pelagicoccus enzymogenes TaxID=2773457 RepID=A0A927F8T6_9BACT|nr:TonB-dependent receptor [Pelagicoccus enzymogenes]MBD5779028.1 TonB-dependent receptor [Pelagicoccus enzymogenes]